MKTYRKQLYQHIHTVIVHAEILLIACWQLHQPKGKETKNIRDVYVILIREDINRHQYDIEVRYRLKEGDVGDENSGMLSTLFLDVVKTGDQQRDWIEVTVLMVDRTAVASSMMSISPEK